MTVLHGHVSILEILVPLVWVLVMKATAFDASEMELVLGVSVRECLRRVGITEEQAALIMKMPLSQFRKALRGEDNYQIGAARLMRLGLVFMAALAPLLLYHSARFHAEQILEDATDAAKAMTSRRRV